MRGYRYWPHTIAALAVMMIAALWLFTASFPYLDEIQPAAGDAAATLNANHEYVQTFTAEADSISRIELILDKMDPKSQGSMRFEIREYKGTDPEGSPVLGDVLREVTLDIGSFDYMGGHRFEFDPLPVTSGAVYAIRLTSDNPEDKSIWVMGTATNDYKGITYIKGTLFENGEPNRGELYFVLYHNTGIAGLLAKIVPFRPEPLSSAVFFEALFVIGAGSFGWLLWEVAAGGGKKD
ncbi:MAG: hypothetical protein M1539_05960 [Actinobacteria bacterium]|nr:hypothetical protein [Actinomycetota bacterium]MCL5883506.1 hypothetical protein [Actinomycetota bacterium]